MTRGGIAAGAFIHNVSDSPTDIFSRLASLSSPIPVGGPKRETEDSFHLDDEDDVEKVDEGDDDGGGRSLRVTTEAVILLENSSRYVLELEESAERFDWFQCRHSFLASLSRLDIQYVNHRSALMETESTARWQNVWSIEAAERSDLVRMFEHQRLQEVHASAVAEHVMLGAEIDSLHRDKDALCRSALQFALHTVGTVKSVVSTASTLVLPSSHPGLTSPSAVEQQRVADAVSQTCFSVETLEHDGGRPPAGTESARDKETIGEEEVERRQRVDEDLAHTKLELLMQTAAAVGASHGLKLVHDRCGTLLHAVLLDEERQRSRLAAERSDFLVLLLQLSSAERSRQEAAEKLMVLEQQHQQQHQQQSQIDSGSTTADQVPAIVPNPDDVEPITQALPDTCGRVDGINVEEEKGPKRHSCHEHLMNGEAIQENQRLVRFWLEDFASSSIRHVGRDSIADCADILNFGSELMSIARRRERLFRGAVSLGTNEGQSRNWIMFEECEDLVNLMKDYSLEAAVLMTASSTVATIKRGSEEESFLAQQARLDDAQREAMKFQQMFGEARDKLAHAESAAAAYRNSTEQQLAALREQLHRAQATAAEANVNRERDVMMWKSKAGDLQEVIEALSREKDSEAKAANHFAADHAAAMAENSRKVQSLEHQLHDSKHEVAKVEAERVALEASLHRVKIEARDAQLAALRHKDTEIERLMSALAAATEAIRQSTQDDHHQHQQQQQPASSPSKLNSPKSHLLRSAVEQNRRITSSSSLPVKNGTGPLPRHQGSDPPTSSGNSPSRPTNQDPSGQQPAANVPNSHLSASQIDLTRQLDRLAKANDVLRKRVQLLQAKLDLAVEFAVGAASEHRERSPVRGNPASSIRRGEMHRSSNESGGRGGIPTNHQTAADRLASVEKALETQQAASSAEILLLREEVDCLTQRLRLLRSTLKPRAAHSDPSRVMEGEGSSFNTDMSCALDDLVPPFFDLAHQQENAFGKASKAAKGDEQVVQPPLQHFADPGKLSLRSKELHFVLPTAGVAEKLQHAKRDPFAYDAKNDPHLRGFFSAGMDSNNRSRSPQQQSRRLAASRTGSRSTSKGRMPNSHVQSSTIAI